MYWRALAITVAFALAGKLADLVISRVIARLASRSSGDFDDQPVALLHRPVFITFVLIRLALATRRLGLASSPE